VVDENRRGMVRMQRIGGEQLSRTMRSILEEREPITVMRRGGGREGDKK